MSYRRIVLPLIVTLISCTDSAEQDGVVDPGQPPISSFSIETSTAESIVRVKKNGKTKRYKVKVDDRSQRIALTTVDDFDDCETQIIPDEECAVPVGDEQGDVGDWEVDEEVYVGYDPPPLTAGYFCPPTTNGLSFTKRDHKFDIDGTFQRLTHETYPYPIFAKATYRVPPGPHTSLDGKMVMWSGTVRVGCNIQQYRTLLPFDVQYGHIWVVGVSGDFYEKPDEPGGEEGDNWAHRMGGDVDGESWQIVEDYLEDGTCTDGWAIYVDGDRVC